MTDHIELYYDHYKDSFQEVSSHIIRRERYFAIAVVLISASMYTTFEPTYVQEVSSAVSTAQLGIDLKLAFYTINSVLGFLSAWYLLRYYQTVLIIENLYHYIHKVESHLSQMAINFSIAREGDSYLNPYPILKKWIHYFYFTIFPILTVIASSIKGYWEVYALRSSIPAILLIFDLGCLTLIVVFTLLYYSWVNFKDFKIKNNQP